MTVNTVVTRRKGFGIRVVRPSVKSAFHSTGVGYPWVGRFDRRRKLAARGLPSLLLSNKRKPGKAYSLAWRTGCVSPGRSDWVGGGLGVPPGITPLLACYSPNCACSHGHKDTGQWGGRVFGFFDLRTLRTHPAGTGLPWSPFLFTTSTARPLPGGPLASVPSGVAGPGWVHSAARAPDSGVSEAHRSRRPSDVPYLVAGQGRLFCRFLRRCGPLRRPPRRPPVRSGPQGMAGYPRFSLYIYGD